MKIKEQKKKLLRGSNGFAHMNQAMITNLVDHWNKRL